MNNVDLAKARTITPTNLVNVIPTRTELPISLRALYALISLLPDYDIKFIAIWLQNSTPNPKLVTKFTTNTALCSIGYPPNTSLRIHILAINSKKTRNTHNVINNEIYRLDITYIKIYLKYY